jgi:hypothetical protein
VAKVGGYLHASTPRKYSLASILKDSGWAPDSVSTQ